MISPLLSPPSCNRRNDTAFCALWRAFVAARSRSPSIQKCSETKAPRTSRNGQHPTFQTVPAATALSFLPSWISSEVCSGCHTRHADASFCPLSAVMRTDVMVLSFSLLTKVDLACLPAGLVATAAEDRLSLPAATAEHLF